MTSHESEVVAPAEQGAGTAKRKSLGPLRRTLREVGLALITLGVIVLLFVAYQLFGTGIAEAHSQRSLSKEFQSEITANGATQTTPKASGAGASTTVAPTPNPQSPAAAPLPGGAVDRIVIPRIGVNKIVVEGVGASDLRKGPGHYPSTVLPGQKGNAAIAGHRTTYGAPFYRLNELTVGDPIDVTDATGRTFVYKVTQQKVVDPSDVSVLDPTPYAELTLTTCNPRFSAATRLIVVARLSSGNALPATTPATPEGSETTGNRVDNPTVSPEGSGAQASASATPTNLGSGDSAAWAGAILFGLLVVLLWVAVRILINRTRRWYRVAAYVIGIGVCLIPLWFLFDNVVLLLPQSI